MKPIGLQAAPASAPRRLRTNADLRALQRLMVHTLAQPLGPDGNLAPRLRDGRSMRAGAAGFIKPNDRLDAVERLQIYARCYWYRLLDCVHEDCPGLRGLLGPRKFDALVQAYLAKYPSRSFTLRNLCARLSQFIAEEPRWTAPRTRLAEAIARFEWAQTVAFDGEARPPLTADDIADAPPTRLRVALQPYLSLLAPDWPVDDYVIAVKKRDALRETASNASKAGGRAESGRRIRSPRRRRVYVVVHRYSNRLFYKRVEAPAFAILTALARGRTVSQALTAAGSSVQPGQVREWFATWMELGWFCRR